MKEYKCECGKLFYEPQRFNGHKQGCHVHIIKKYGSLDAYYAIKNRNIDKAVETARKNYEARKQKELEEWILAQHKCKVCGRTMTEKYGSGIYCSPYCAHSRPATPESNMKRSATMSGPNQTIKPIEYWEQRGLPNYCPQCGKEINRSKKYCSSKCQCDFQYQQWIKQWKSGEVSGLTRDSQNSSRLRRYVLEKYNYTCTRCGWSEQNQYTKSYPLEVEHIDGDYKNTKEENLTLLCPNCHSLTRTYKGANRGRGRPQRRIGYKKQ